MGDPDDREDGRLAPQNNHLTGVWTKFFYRSEMGEVRKWSKKATMIIVTRATQSKSKKQFRHGVQTGFLSANLRSRAGGQAGPGESPVAGPAVDKPGGGPPGAQGPQRSRSGPVRPALGRPWQAEPCVLAPGTP